MTAQHIISKTSPDTLIQQACMDAVGAAPPIDLILSKLNHWLRFSPSGKPSDLACALKVYPVAEGYVYIIKDHRLGTTKKGCTGSFKKTRLTPEELARAKRQRYEAEQKAIARANKQRRLLASLVKPVWSSALSPNEWPNEFPYLAAKGHLPPLNVKRFISNHHDVLLLPMIEPEKHYLASLYLIYANGFKRPLLGTKSQGLCMAIGGKVAEAKTLWLVEGYATGLSLYLEVKQTVVVCFSAHNLQPVAEKLVLKYPNTELRLCADDDRATAARLGRNPGLEYALKLQQRFPQIALYKPIFPDNAPMSLSDINDVKSYWDMQGEGGEV